MADALKDPNIVKRFCFCSNDDSVIPKEIAQLKNLEYLQIRGTKIDSFPSEILELSHLRIIELIDAAALQQFPIIITKLTSIKELNIISTNIKAIPSSIGELKNLETLILIGEFTYLPPEISKLEKLTYFRIEVNLDKLPITFGALKNLKVLDISNSKIGYLPESIYNLKSLHAFIARGATISSIPYDFVELDSLKLIDISNANFTDRYYCIYLLSKLSNLDSLDISGLGLNYLPNELCELKNLKYLNLENNYLKELPRNFSNLQSLTSLDLSGNSFKEIPYNPYRANTSEIPAEIYKLKTIERLDLSDCNIEYLGDSIKYLTNLTEINLDYNLFCEIPEELYFLDQISSISLSNNSISRIDENIRKFSNLEYLDLSGNPLCGELPESISTLKKLRSFYLKQPDENENNSTKIYKECGYSNYNQKCFFTSEQKLKMEKLLPLCNITF